jgi:hypothetical protein
MVVILEIISFFVKEHYKYISCKRVLKFAVTRKYK